MSDQNQRIAEAMHTVVKSMRLQIDSFKECGDNWDADLLDGFCRPLEAILLDMLVGDGPLNTGDAAYTMTNAELSEAIEAATSHAGMANAIERLWGIHMRRLMHIQEQRASMLRLDTTPPPMVGEDNPSDAT